MYKCNLGTGSICLGFLTRCKDNGEWKQITFEKPPPPRYGATAVVYGRNMYMFGGYEVFDLFVFLRLFQLLVEEFKLWLTRCLNYEYKA